MHQQNKLATQIWKRLGKWDKKYPNTMKSWEVNRDCVSPIFKFSSDVRKVIYTANTIKSLNSSYKQLNHQRSIFPSDTALLKALYLAAFEAAKKWTYPLRNRDKVYGELTIMNGDRIEKQHQKSEYQG